MEKSTSKQSTTFFERAGIALADLGSIWGYELRQSFRDVGMLIFFLIVPLIYPLLYSYIYSREVVREVPIAVVDHAATTQSREYLRRVQATPEVSIVASCANMEEAKEYVRTRRAYGIVYMPRDFSECLMRGEQSHVSVYSDMSSLLYYKSILLANTQVSLEMNKDIKLERSPGLTVEQGEVLSYPLVYEEVPLYNPSTGFASFLLPAVLILIIQQTLLLGIGLSAGTAREQNSLGRLIPVGNRHYTGTLRIVLGKALAYVLIYILVVLYTLVFVPALFDFVQLADLGDLLLFVLPYVLACVFFAMTLSVFVRHREACMLVFVFTSVPLLFLSGVSWPGASLPEQWRWVSYLAPSTFGINGYIKLNSMGAKLEDIRMEYLALWGQVLCYFVSTCIVYYVQLHRSPADGECDKSTVKGASQGSGSIAEQ